VSIETAEVLEGRLPRRARSLVLEWAAAHRDEWQHIWELARANQPLPAIAGLEWVEEVGMILRIREARVCGPHSLRLTFNDGTTKQVNVRPLLDASLITFGTYTIRTGCSCSTLPRNCFAPNSQR